MDTNHEIKLENEPLIFIHFGDIFYLRFTLLSAKKHNSSKVILIGDKDNKKYEDLGVIHYNFEDYTYGDAIDEFNNVYELIGGTRFLEINKSKGQDWTKFNFLKWFVLLNFLEKNKINSCWTFDSDNMILCDLREKSYAFEYLDCTVRPSFSMIFGKINNPDLLRDYCLTILNLFGNKKFLDSQKDEFIFKPEFGFTMMRAFMIFYRRNKKKYKIDKLEKVINKEIFLDTLLVNRNKTFEIENKKFGRFEVISLYKKNDSLFVKEYSSENFIRLNSIDLSWVPEYYFSKIIKETLSPKNINLNYKKIVFLMPLSYWLRNKAYRLRKIIGLVK